MALRPAHFAASLVQACPSPIRHLTVAPHLTSFLSSDLHPLDRSHLTHGHNSSALTQHHWRSRHQVVPLLGILLMTMAVVTNRTKRIAQHFRGRIPQNYSYIHHYFTGRSLDAYAS